MLLDFILHPVHCNIDFTIMFPSGKNEWTCPECGNRAILEDPDDEDSLYYENDPDDSYGSYYDDIPEGCRACGNPNYPECTSSCNLMSD